MKDVMLSVCVVSCSQLCVLTRWSVFKSNKRLLMTDWTLISFSQIFSRSSKIETDFLITKCNDSLLVTSSTNMMISLVTARSPSLSKWWKQSSSLFLSKCCRVEVFLSNSHFKKKIKFSSEISFVTVSWNKDFHFELYVVKRWFRGFSGDFVHSFFNCCFSCDNLMLGFSCFRRDMLASS